MDKNKQIVRNLLPFFMSTALVYLFWRQSYLLLFFYVSMLTAVILLGRERIEETKLAALGILWGIVLETVGVKSGYHTFNKADFLGVPFWLPIFWGYGFVTAKRVSSAVYTGSAFKIK